MAASSLHKCFLTGDFFLHSTCWKWHFSLKRNLTASLPTHLKRKKGNLNRAVEIKFSVLKCFLVLRNLDFTLIFHQRGSYHEKKALDNLPFLCFKKHILITETGGQAWLLHHRHFNQYWPEHFRKKTLELKSISLLKKKKWLQDYQNSREVL